MWHLIAYVVLAVVLAGIATGMHHALWDYLQGRRSR